MREILSVLSGLLFITAFFPYIYAILYKDAKPSKASWLIWWGSDFLAFAGMLAKHSLNWQITAAVLGGITVVLLSLKKGTPGWTLSDKLCFAGAAGGALLWWITDNANMAIIASQAIVFIGSIPTALSVWKDPTRENPLAWMFYTLSCIAAVVAIPTWDIAHALQPCNFLLVDGGIAFVLLAGRIHAWLVKEGGWG
jgi:hypothetical protein